MIHENAITFVNHASVLINGDNCGLLCDPWYSGLVFNNGWSLIYENKQDEILNILDKTNYIWISHEHPDHFSVDFFRNYKEQILEKNISVLFQQTKDKRVAKFIQSLGINLIELCEGKIFKIEKNFTIEIEKCDFYDSLAIIRVNGVDIFNLNDCPIQTKSELENLKKRHGKCKILLTQFNYAAWKGGRYNFEWRKKAALAKLATMNLQASILEAEVLIPFASFIKFSNLLNNYLNEDANTPKKIIKYFEDNPLIDKKLLFLPPMSSIKLNYINSYKNSYNGVSFWENALSRNNILFEYQTSKDLNDINHIFKKYINRLKKNNNFNLIKLASKLPYFNLFSKINFLLLDTHKIISIDIPNEILTISENEYWDISLHSESLLFILKYQYGFDTLTINSCFEVSSPFAFKKLCKTFALENLNNIGYTLSFKGIFRIDFIKLVYLFFKRLRSI